MNGSFLGRRMGHFFGWFHVFMYGKGSSVPRQRHISYPWSYASHRTTSLLSSLQQAHFRVTPSVTKLKVKLFIFVLSVAKYFLPTLSSQHTWEFCWCAYFCPYREFVDVPTTSDAPLRATTLLPIRRKTYFRVLSRAKEATNLSQERTSTGIVLRTCWATEKEP